MGFPLKHYQDCHATDHDQRRASHVSAPLTVAELCANLVATRSDWLSRSMRSWFAKDEQPNRTLSDGDRVEIVTLVGGGESSTPRRTSR